MNRLRILFAALMFVASGYLFSIPALAARESGLKNDTVAAFSDHVSELDSVNDQQKKAALEAIDEFSDSPSDAITEGLIALYPDYAKAVEASDNDDVSSAQKLLQSFAESDDKFLAADASFYLARALMNDEQFESALPLLKKLHNDLPEFTPHAGTAQFYLGVAQAGMLETKKAVNSLMEFLEMNPTAPERLRVAAWRQIQELRGIDEAKMEGVYQKMDFSRRKLKLHQPDDVTQVEQKKIIDTLAKLIKEQEKKEASSSSSKPNAKKQQEQKQQQQQKKQDQKKDQKSQQGGTSNNSNSSAQKKSYSDDPTSPWSRLRERTRDAANNAVKDRLPPHYRDIVERYYDKVNGDDQKKW